MCLPTSADKDGEREGHLPGLGEVGCSLSRSFLNILSLLFDFLWRISRDLGRDLASVILVKSRTENRTSTTELSPSGRTVLEPAGQVTWSHSGFSVGEEWSIA